jgi:O-antigen/teichoic acid export membrane protein
VGKMLMGIVSFTLVVRMLGPEKYGNLILFVTVVSVAGIFLNWNNNAIVRFGKEEYLENDRLRETFSASFFLAISSSLVIIPLFIAFRSRLIGFIGLNGSMIYMLAAAALTTLFAAQLPIFFQASNRMKQYSYIPLSANIFFLLVVFSMSIGFIRTDIYLLILASIVGNLLVVSLSLTFLWKDFFPTSFSFQRMKRQFSYSFPMIFGGASQYIVEYIDVIVIKMFLPIAFVGIYSVAYRLQNYLILIPMLSITLMFPLMTSLVVKKREEAIDKYIQDYAPQIAFCWCILCIIVLCFSREVFLIFGSKYKNAVIPFMVLLLGIYFRIFPIIESPILSSYGLIKEMVILSLGTSIINLILDYLLVQRVGITGASIATTIAFIFTAISRTLLVKHKLHIDNFKSYLWAIPVIVALACNLGVLRLSIRAVMAFIIIALAIHVAKKKKVFTSESLKLIDQINMPQIIRVGIKRGYTYLL